MGMIGAGAQMGQAVLGGVGDIVGAHARNSQLEGEYRQADLADKKNRQMAIMSMLR